MIAAEQQWEPEPRPNAKAAVLGFRIRHWPWQERTPVEILRDTPRSSWDGEDTHRHCSALPGYALGDQHHMDGLGASSLMHRPASYLPRLQP
jgi:hypothetical protein